MNTLPIKQFAAMATDVKVDSEMLRVYLSDRRIISVPH